MVWKIGGDVSSFVFYLSVSVTSVSAKLCKVYGKEMKWALRKPWSFLKDEELFWINPNGYVIVIANSNLLIVYPNSITIKKAIDDHI